MMMKMTARRDRERQSLTKFDMNFIGLFNHKTLKIRDTLKQMRRNEEVNTQLVILTMKILIQIELI